MDMITIAASVAGLGIIVAASALGYWMGVKDGRIEAHTQLFIEELGHFELRFLRNMVNEEWEKRLASVAAIAPQFNDQRKITVGSKWTYVYRGKAQDVVVTDVRKSYSGHRVVFRTLVQSLGEQPTYTTLVASRFLRQCRPIVQDNLTQTGEAA